MRLPAAALVAALACGCSGGQVEPDEPDPAANPNASGARPASAAKKASGARRVDTREATQDGPPVLQRAAVDKVIAAGPGWLLGQVPIEPVRDKAKKFLGYRIVSVFGDSPAALRYGVLPGDRVLSVQGQALLVPTDLLQVFQKLKTAEQLQVKVVRNGEEKQFSWPIVRPGQRLPAAPTATEAPPPADEKPDAPVP